MPVIAYWGFSLFFHILDTYDLLPQYRLHTPEELLKRNRVTRFEVVKEVVIQHIIQTIIGGIAAYWEPVQYIGGEELEILGLYTKMLRFEKAIGLSVAGVGKGDWRYAAVEFAYWYAIPAMRLWFAIFLLDTWQYFLHRLMHEVKWLYSEHFRPHSRCQAG